MQNIFFTLSERYRAEHGVPDLVHAFIDSRGNTKTGPCIAHYAIPYPALKAASEQQYKKHIDIDNFKDTCGHCALRTGHKGTKCYVLHGYYPRLALASVINGVALAKYDFLGEVDGAFEHPLFTDKFVRFGAFGEGVDLGSEIFVGIALQASTYTSYTRKWMMPAFEWASDFAQASVFNLKEEVLANEKNFKTYRLIQKADDLKTVQPSSILCPASKEAGRISNCANCKLCDGSANIHIHEH